MPAWLWVAMGVWVGQSSPQVLWNMSDLYSFIERILVPLYTVGVILFITALFVRDFYWQERKKVLQEEPLLDPISEGESDEEESDEDNQAEQPVDMTGRYKLVSLENFGPFLEVQGASFKNRLSKCC